MKSVSPLLTLGSAVGAMLALLALIACEDTSPATPCVNIPANGCPEEDGLDVCQDPMCASAYACQNGKWVFDKTCPPRDGGAGDGDGGILVRDSGVRDVLVTDAPPGAYGGPGCVDLEPPDCPLGTALSCGGQQDCCGCEDLFVCVDGGWNPWGTCVDGGAMQR
jgi:hypothetical protein